MGTPTHHLGGRSLPPPTQSGFALLALIAVVALGAIFVFVSSLNANSSQLERAQITQRALSLAREALIARAVADTNRPGSLPCPAADENGVAGSTVGTGPGDPCPSSQYLGRFPWKTLGVSDLRDAYNEQLWYVLAQAYRDHPTAGPLNTTTTGELSVGAASDIVAIVLAPGPPLPTQIGRPSNSIGDYLEGENADGNLAFADLPASATFNDRLLAITRDDLFHLVTRRVLAELRGTGSPASSGLLKYEVDSGVFPWADTDGDGYENPSEGSGAVPNNDLTFPSWITSNGWLPLVNYEVDAGQTKMSVRIVGMSITCMLASCL